MKKFTTKVTIVLVLILVCVLSLAVLVACGEKDQHEHNYSAWGSDENGHWKVCPDDNAIDESSKGAHTDSDGDELCDACGYNMHQHNFAGDWQKDADGHWQVCAKDNATNKTAHVDANNDKKCDVCGWNMCTEHSYTTWACDGINHWKLCEYCGAKDNSSVANHTGKAEEKCSECGGYIIGECDHYYEINADGITEPSIEWNYDDYYNPTTVKSTTDGSAHIKCDTDGCLDKDIVLKALPFNTQITTAVDAYQCVYYYWDMTDPYVAKATISIGTGTTVEMVLTKERKWDNDAFNYVTTWTSVGMDMANDAIIEQHSGIVFKAYSSDGNISFKLLDAPGSSRSAAIELTKNSEYTGKDAKWLKYTASANEELVVYNKESSISYDDDYFLEQYPYISMSIDDDEYNETYISHKYTVISMTGGSTYYFYLPTMYTGYNNEQQYYAFKLMDKEAGKSYLGYSPDSAMEITDGTITASSDIIGTRYYKWTADVAGNIVTTLTATPEGAYSNAEIMIYNSTYKEWGASYDDIVSVKAGDTIVIAVEYYSDATSGSYTLTVKSEAPKAVDHTITVKDYEGNALKNVTVSITIDSETTVTGTTDSDGKVTLNFMSGTYDIELSDYDITKYIYGGESTDAINTEYEITLISLKKTNTFKVKASSGDGISGVTVKVMDGTTEMASGTTGSDGTVSLTYDGKASGSYKVELSGYSDDYYPRSSGYSVDATKDGGTVTCNLYAYTIYTITAELGDGVTGVSLEGLTIQLYESNYWTGEETLAGSGATNASGVATIKTTTSGMNSIIIKISNLPDGYTASATIASAYPVVTTATITINSDSGTTPVTPAGNVLAIGENNIALAVGANYWPENKTYTFTASEKGTYTITVTDDSKCAIIALKDFEKGVIIALEDPESGESKATGSFKFYLLQGQTITLIIGTGGYDACEYTVSVTYTAPEEGGIEPSTETGTVEVGHNVVHATYDGIEYKFEVESDGEYVISSPSENFYLTSPDGTFEAIGGSDATLTLTLKAGDIVSLVFCTYDDSVQNDYYIININDGAR